LGSDLKRYSLRLNSDIKVSDKITAGFSVAPNHTITNSPNTDGIFWSAALIQNALLSWRYFHIKMKTNFTVDGLGPAVCTFPTQIITERQ